MGTVGIGNGSFLTMIEGLASTQLGADCDEMIGAVVVGSLMSVTLHSAPLRIACKIICDWASCGAFALCFSSSRPSSENESVKLPVSCGITVICGAGVVWSDRVAIWM